jgi:medium-chain acyl-[acyl-carrier-protein] hydrolase
VTNWSIRVIRYPKVNDEILINTYPIRTQGVIGERGFEVYSETGELLLTAYSIWAYADLKNQKLLRPPVEIIVDFGEFFPPPMEKKLRFPSYTKDENPYYLTATREYIVTRRDIDTNDHVNNVKYIEWAMDDIPESFYNANRVRETKVNYKKQCRLGDKVVAEFYSHIENPNCFLSVFRNSDNKSVLVEIFSNWSAKKIDWSEGV